MRPSDLVRLVHETCERLGLAYFVSGSVASSYYGEYRNTLDVDIVVDLPAPAISPLCSAFAQPEWYLSEEAAYEAVQRSGMFNIIHVPSGLKIDVSVLRPRPADELRMDRRTLVTLEGGIRAWFAAPEDVILAKLEFYQLGGSDKHVRDIAGMLKTLDVPIDMAYLDHWALRLGVHREWAALKIRLGMA
ncbi:MAG: hypothetical protein KF678_04240 [Phycisphaeraceae bacterium]|nr:hypothetical protein [Phycisphaeraceae bacterium]